MVVEIKTDEEFKSTLEKSGDSLIVVDFFATWCGPCKSIAPKLQELSEQMTDVIFLKVDVDDFPDLAAEYNINSMPTFIFIKGGKVLETFSGANYEKLKLVLQKHM